MARRSTLLTYSDEGDDSNTSYDNFCVSRVRNKEITRLFIFQEVGEISIGERFFDSCRCYLSDGYITLCMYSMLVR